jgi:hypothetical protein
MPGPGPCIFKFMVALMIQIEAEYFKKGIVREFADSHPWAW